MKQLILLLSLSIMISSQLIGQTATEIIAKSRDNFRGETHYVEMTMNIVRPTWNREMTLKSWEKGQKNSLILITAPARDKGTTFLKRDKEIWNWVPTIERSIKLPPSMMMQSWMGSDFTNDDLVQNTSTVEDYTHKIIKEEEIEGYKCWKIELTPNPDAPVVWGKIISWISQEHFLQLRTEFFDEEGYLVNTMASSKVQLMGGRMIPTHMEMIPADKEGNKTTMTYLKVEYNKPIEDSFFSVQNMKRVR